MSYPISGKKASLSSGRPGVVNPHEDDGPQKSFSAAFAGLRARCKV